jgi:hypothetical protein
MAHYAFINADNVVTEVITGIDETQLIEGIEPETWYGNYRGQQCVRTSYNAATNGYRKQYAGVGFTYDHVRDEFVAWQPYLSWTLDENNDWQPPTPKPDGDYYWNEDTQTWQPFEQP